MVDRRPAIGPRPYPPLATAQIGHDHAPIITSGEGLSSALLLKHMLGVKNRSANVHDAKASLATHDKR